jgi:hypothetical protein
LPHRSKEKALSDDRCIVVVEADGWIDYIGPFEIEQDALKWVDAHSLSLAEMSRWSIARLIDPDPIVTNRPHF